MMRIPVMAYLIEADYDVYAADEARGNRKIGIPLHHAIQAKSLVKVEFLL